MNSKEPKSMGQARLSLDGRAAVASAIEQVIEVFRCHLEDVAFPDVSLEAIERAVATVHERAEQLETARQQVALAEAELHEAQRSLSGLSERGMAYARVFAEGNAELTAALDGIPLGAPQRRKPRRARKAAAEPSKPRLVEEGAAPPKAGKPEKDSHLTIVG